MRKIKEYNIIRNASKLIPGKYVIMFNLENNWDTLCKVYPPFQILII